MKNKLYIKTWGGLGDVVLTTPVFKAFKARFPGMKIIVFCHSPGGKQVLENNPYIDRLTLVNVFNLNWYALLAKLNLIKVVMGEYAKVRPSFCYKKSASEIIAELMGVELTDTHLQIYPDKQEEINARKILGKYKNPIIIHITSVASKNQMWPVEKWNELVRQMPDYTFIQLGLSREERVEGAIDLRGKTTIPTSIALVKHAISFVGVVSFFAHLTNAFDKPGVVLYGPSSIVVWGHPNNINVSKGLPCSNCMDWLVKPCPYGKPCMLLITVKEVKDALSRQLAFGNRDSVI